MLPHKHKLGSATGPWIQRTGTEPVWVANTVVAEMIYKGGNSPFSSGRLRSKR